MKHLNRIQEINTASFIDSWDGFPMQGPSRQWLKTRQIENKKEKKRSNFHHWKPFMQASILVWLFKNVTFHLTGWRSDLFDSWMCDLFAVSSCWCLRACRHANLLPEVQLEFIIGCTLSCKHTHFGSSNQNSQKDEQSNESVSNYRVTFLECNNWEIGFSIKSWSFIRSYECRWEFVKSRLNVHLGRRFLYKVHACGFHCHAKRIWYFVSPDYEFIKNFKFSTNV